MLLAIAVVQSVVNERPHVCVVMRGRATTAEARHP